MDGVADGVPRGLVYGQGTGWMVGRTDWRVVDEWVDEQAVGLEDGEWRGGGWIGDGLEDEQNDGWTDRRMDWRMDWRMAWRMGGQTTYVKICHRVHNITVQNTAASLHQLHEGGPAALEDEVLRLMRQKEQTAQLCQVYLQENSYLEERILQAGALSLAF